jgi:hypothetical protein
LTHEQLQGWQQAFEQEPWGDFREDMRAVVAMGPAHDEKLKEARRKHLEMMKAQKRG